MEGHLRDDPLLLNDDGESAIRTVPQLYARLILEELDRAAGYAADHGNLGPNELVGAWVRALERYGLGIHGFPHAHDR